MTKKIDQDLIQQLIQQANDSPRLRSNINFHTETDDPVQRLFISLKRGTYVRPHHHPSAEKWEMMMAVHGEQCLVIFEPDGKIKEKLSFSPGDSLMGVELPPNTWHTLYPTSDVAVVLELKAGPYTPAQPSDFAAWAPQEGEPDAARFLDWVATAEVGEQYS